MSVQTCPPEFNSDWANANDDEKRWRIVIAHKYFNMSFPKISAMFGCTEPFAAKIWTRYNTFDGDQKKSNPGRQKKMSKQDTEDLKTEIEKNRMITIPKMSLTMLVSESTISSKLKELGYKKMKPVERPALTPQAIRKRIEYCLRHKYDKFSNVIFCDEAIIQLQENRHLLWSSPAEERPTLAKIHSNMKIMIWAGIARKGKTEVKVFRLDKEESCNGISYLKTIEDYCIAKGNKMFGEGKWRLEQDNARPHLVKPVKDLLTAKKVSLVEHPAWSPDLNPIEKIWGWLKDCVNVVTYKNCDELVEAVNKVWNSLTLDRMNKVIDHQMTIIPKILENNGSYVK